MQIVGRRWARLAAATLMLAAAGCSGGTEALTYLVDYSHDEFATQFIAFFPDTIQAHPGDTIAFRQTWTGEPHTVTFGTVVDDAIGITQPLIEEWGSTPEEEIPEEVLEEFGAAEETLPQTADWEAEDWDGTLNQLVGQPCLIQDGPLPDPFDPCEVSELPAFDGTAAWYNSGIIPYEGTAGNVFDLELADTVEPGIYSFYCAFHGPFQAGTIEVVPEEQDVPTPREVSIATREQVSEQLEPLRNWFEEARDEGTVTVDEEVFAGPFAGLPGTAWEVPKGGAVNEFVPRDLETSVGEPVTWRLFGPHTISFDVPEYFPIAEFDEDGTVRYNLDVEAPAGGAPDLPPEEELEGPVSLDGGTFDGSGFWSSGLMYGDGNVEYTVRFSTPGSYTYACLIHPPMIGTVVVTG